MNWSKQQLAIFDWFKASERNLIVRARAGTGKTTTILEALSYAPERRILLAAFNKSIATELADRVSHPGAEAKTLHGVGFSCIRRYWDRIKVDARTRADSLSREALGGGAPLRAVRLVSKLHTKAREMAPLATEGGDLVEIAYRFDCLPDDLLKAEGFDLAAIEDGALKAMELAASERPSDGAIDFADMLYLPVRNGWLRPTWDLVVVDEAQDMNQTQLTIARGVCKGRMAVVGDDRQAIYGFRGADSGAIDRLKRELEAVELGLNITYRCGTKIVAEAAALVPDFEAAPSNPPGQVKSMSIQALPSKVEPGDFVISRTNAPLIGTALQVLRAGKRCKISGRDFSRGLLALIRNLAKGRRGMPQFLGALTEFEEREMDRARASKDAGAEERLGRIIDQADTIRALAVGLLGVRGLESRIADLFEDNSGRPTVICSSVHRAKGLEADRVLLLANTFRAPRWIEEREERDPARELEEANLRYVAITRAKAELWWVS